MRLAHNFALQSYTFFFKYTSFFCKKCCFRAMRFLFLGKKRLLTYKFTKFYVFSALYCLKMWSTQKKAVPLQPEMRYERFSLISINADSLAQLVEHNTFNVGVVGSSPTRITKSRLPMDIGNLFYYKSKEQAALSHSLLFNEIIRYYLIDTFVVVEPWRRM